MKITQIETLQADAGWRMFSFLKVTTDDGVTRNDTAQVADVNSWSYLALQDPAYAASVGWDVSHLSAPAAGYRGLSYCASDRSGIWFEGTAQVADALRPFVLASRSPS